MEAKTWILFDSRKSLRDFQQFLIDNADSQGQGFTADYSIVTSTGNSFYSALDPFTITQKLCRDFDQVACDSIQCGDMGLVNADTVKANNDTSQAGTLTQSKARCWYNIKVSCRVSSFSQCT